MRNEYNRKTHDEAVVSIASQIGANYGDRKHGVNLPQSPTINGHIPDLMNGNDIYEIETSDSIDSDHTYGQLSAWVSNGHNVAVYVPYGYAGIAAQQLAKWNLNTVRIGEY